MTNVMVLDDSKTARSYHSTILKKFGINVIEAENGLEALKKSTNTTISLYLVDISMPIMDGFAFVEEIRKNENYATTPIIMITTQTKSGDKLEAYKRGANLFAIKPIDIDLLRQFITILLPQNNKKENV
jgi:two-component system chemotaxis response regulator CheY